MIDKSIFLNSVVHDKCYLYTLYLFLKLKFFKPHGLSSKYLCLYDFSIIK